MAVFFSSAHLLFIFVCPLYLLISVFFDRKTGSTGVLTTLTHAVLVPLTPVSLHISSQLLPCGYPKEEKGEMEHERERDAQHAESFPATSKNTYLHQSRGDQHLAPYGITMVPHVRGNVIYSILGREGGQVSCHRTLRTWKKHLLKATAPGLEPCIVYDRIWNRLDPWP